MTPLSIDRNLSRREFGKQLKAALAAEWPHVKWSVRADRGSAWEWVNVYWEFGPTWERVREFTANTEPQDSEIETDYAGSGWKLALARSIPDTVLEEVARALCEANGVGFHDIDQQHLYGPEDPEDTERLGTRVHMLVSGTEWPAGKVFDGVDSTFGYLTFRDEKENQG